MHSRILVFFGWGLEILHMMMQSAPSDCQQTDQFVNVKTVRLCLLLMMWHRFHQASVSSAQARH